jgi:hypothetical protein
VPEQLLLELYSMRVDYYFARIGRHTDIMIGIFAAVGAEDEPAQAACLCSLFRLQLDLRGLLPSPMLAGVS